MKAPLAILPVLLLGAPSCGGGDAPGEASEPEAVEPTTPDEPEQEAPSSGSSTRRRRDRGGSGGAIELLASEPVESEELGGLHGEMRLKGDPPARFDIGAGQKTECTHHPEIDHLSERVIAANGKLANVYVTIARGYDEDAIPTPPDTPAVLDQRGCVYTPHVMAVQVGRQLLVKNSDPTTHNVNVNAPKNNETGNVNMGAGQDPIPFVFEREEEKIRFKCDIHPWMLSWMHVSEHPWFAVTGADGSFRIAGVPPGKYTVEAIHEHYGKLKGDVEVTAGESTGFALTFE